jgi:hypothetical protein
VKFVLDQNFRAPAWMMRNVNGLMLPGLSGWWQFLSVMQRAVWRVDQDGLHRCRTCNFLGWPIISRYQDYLAMTAGGSLTNGLPNFGSLRGALTGPQAGWLADPDDLDLHLRASGASRRRAATRSRSRRAFAVQMGNIAGSSLAPRRYGTRWAIFRNGTRS